MWTIRFVWNWNIFICIQEFQVLYSEASPKRLILNSVFFEDIFWKKLTGLQFLRDWKQISSTQKLKSEIIYQGVPGISYLYKGWLTEVDILLRWSLRWFILSGSALPTFANHWQRFSRWSPRRRRTSPYSGYSVTVPLKANAFLNFQVRCIVRREALYSG